MHTSGRNSNLFRVGLNSLSSGHAHYEGDTDYKHNNRERLFGKYVRQLHFSVQLRPSKGLKDSQ